MKITLSKIQNLHGQDRTYKIIVDGHDTGFAAWRYRGRAYWVITPPAYLAREYLGREHATFKRLRDVRTSLNYMLTHYGLKAGMKAALLGQEPAQWVPIPDNGPLGPRHAPKPPGK